MTEILSQDDISKKLNFILNKKVKKTENKSEYEKVYFQNFTKNRTRRFEVCSSDIKYNSFINHCKSKKHKVKKNGNYYF